MASRQGQWNAAFQLIEAEIADYHARGLQLWPLRAVIARNSLRLTRSEPDDLTAIARDVGIWRPLAVASRRAELVRQLDVLAATARFWLETLEAHSSWTPTFGGLARGEPF